MNNKKHEAIKELTPFEHPRMLFFLTSFSLYIGIFCGSLGGQKEEILLMICAVLTLLLLLKIRGIIFSLILFLALFLGYNVGHIKYIERIKNIQSVISINNEMGGIKSNFTGTIKENLYIGELYRAYAVNIDNFDNISPQEGEHYRSTILLEIPKNLNLIVGDTIAFEGKIEPLFSGSLDGFEKYSFLHGVGGKISIVTFKMQSRGKLSLFESARDWTEKHIYSGFPRNIAGIILGMTIGEVRLIGKDIQESFRASGISHILVVSGSNITFLILLVSGILKYFNLKKVIRIILIFCIVILYSGLVGWDVPVIRSTIMGLIGFFAIENRKKLSSLAILLLVADIYLILFPLALLYDPAFGLSFGATASIILFYGSLYKKIKAWGIPSSIGSIIAITTAASIGTLPVSLYHFGSISLGFFFANIAIAFVVGWILFCSFLYIIFALFGKTLLYILGIFLYIPVKYVIFISEFFGGWGYIIPPESLRIPVVVIFLSYICSQIIKLDHLDSKVKKEHGYPN